MGEEHLLEDFYRRRVVQTALVRGNKVPVLEIIEIVRESLPLYLLAFENDQRSEPTSGRGDAR